jgi:hypothetical protein
MWRIIYNIATGIVIVVGSRQLQDGEGEIILPPSQCAWANAYPSRYRVENGALVERAEWVQEEADREAAQNAAIAALQARIAGIEAAQSSADLKQYTVQQGTDWITNKLTSAPNTYAGVKQAVGEILIRMLPYILPKN